VDVNLAGSDEWFWEKLQETADRQNVLKHPFYVRWSQGTLSGRELARYAGQYSYLVAALAVASRHAAEKADGRLAATLAAHASEEEAHIDLWREFAEASGGSDSSAARPSTTRCASVWAGDDSRALAHDLVTLYAIESQQPDIARTKLEGLATHYGFEDGLGTGYFQLHKTLDHEHASLAAAALQGLLPSEDALGLLAQAAAVYDGYWRMLDDLEQLGP
jgi:pyrroloquinoline-quinone synthase